MLWVEPHPDPALSLELLRARNVDTRGLTYLHDGHDMLAEWINDHQARGLASLRHYTHGLTPLESGLTLSQQLGSGIADFQLEVASEA